MITGDTVSQTVMSDPVIVMVYLNTHWLTVGSTINVLGNRCGKSILTSRWVFNRKTTFQDEKEINTNIFKLKVGDPDFNGGDGFQPFAFELFSYDNNDVGNYTFAFTVAPSDVYNITSKFFTTEIKIEILPCVSSSALAEQDIQPFVVFYQMKPNTRKYWNDFSQKPACNYTWDYQVYARKVSSIYETSIEYDKFEDLQELDIIDPPIIDNVDSSNRHMEVKCG